MANPSEYPLPNFHPTIAEYITRNPTEVDQIISSVPYWYVILYQ
jgi:hypothetical protein